MVDQLISVDSDSGSKEPTPVSIFANGQIIDFANFGSGSSDPAVAQRLGAITSPEAGTVNASLGAIRTALGSPLQADGTVTIGNASLPVTGTFFPPTQPVSVASLPLPAGAATDATVASLLKAGQSVGVSNFPVTQAISAASLPLPAGAATDAAIGSLLKAGQSINVGNFPTTQPISAANLPLPTGAATSALQSAGNAALSSLDSKSGPIVPTVGQGVTSLLLKASAGNLYSASITAGATAGFLIAYNAVAVPASGAAFTPTLVLNAVAVGANGLASLGGNPVPDRFGTGIVLLFSTSLATYTVPANPAVFMRGSAL